MYIGMALHAIRVLCAATRIVLVCISRKISQDHRVRYPPAIDLVAGIDCGQGPIRIRRRRLALDGCEQV
jgi:hypothetical protein